MGVPFYSSFLWFTDAISTYLSHEDDKNDAFQLFSFAKVFLLVSTAGWLEFVMNQWIMNNTNIQQMHTTLVSVGH